MFEIVRRVEVGRLCNPLGDKFKMKQVDLVESLVAQCDGADLPLTEKVSALRAALTRVQMNVGAAPGGRPSRKVQVQVRKPLLRPSGNLMGKQKREPKSE